MRRYLAETLGTFVLVFGGVGTAVLASDNVGFLGVAVAFGLSLLVMAYAVGPISGCHINPAVTFGMLLSRRISPKDAGGYVVGQIVGAILAAVAILLIAKAKQGGYDVSEGGLGANGYGVHSPGKYALGGVILVEVIGTALLVFTVLAATSKIAHTAFAGIPIGFVLTLIHLVAIPVSNTSVNPARSIGPALMVGDWAISQLWVFILAPLAGAALAAVIHRALFDDLEQRTVSAGDSAVAS
jgi:aquaporin Z